VGEETLRIGEIPASVLAKQLPMPMEHVRGLTGDARDRRLGAGDQQGRSQEPADGHDRHDVVERPSVIHHHDGRSARAQHALELVDRALRLRYMMDHAVRIDEIERLVFERQVGDRAPHELGGSSLELQATPGEIDRGVALVDTRVARSRAHESHSVCRDPASGFEHVLAGPTLELHELQDVWLERKATRLHL
jgi:hypothetical protein